jgi:hypothetical protein
MAGRKNGQQNYSPTIPLRLSPLLDLPIELFLMIWDQLPPYNRACLVLTCRGLYNNAHFVSILRDLNQETPISRSQRLYLLRLLRADLKTKRFLCHSCLKFHEDPHSPIRVKAPPKDHRDYSFPRFELPVGGGFPYCDSVFTFALRDVYDQLRKPTDRGLRYYTGSYASDLRLQYEIKVDVGRQGLFMWTHYVYHDSKSPRVMYPGVHPKPEPAEFASLARRTNIEFCKHLRLGEDFVPGDGSMSDRLETEFARVSSPRASPEFCCSECHVNIKIQASSFSTVQFHVWQAFNPVTLEPWMRPARLDRVELPPWHSFFHPMQKRKSRLQRSLEKVGLR